MIYLFLPHKSIQTIITGQEGTEEWIQTFSGSDTSEGHFVQPTDDGDYDMWLIKTDSEGNTSPLGDSNE